MKARKLAYILSIFSFLSFDCFSDPAVVYFDPGMTHDIFGVNRLPTDPDEWHIDFHLSPFYQHASGARDKNGNKVPLGDRLGRWEMFAVLWGDANKKRFEDQASEKISANVAQGLGGLKPTNIGTYFDTLYTLSHNAYALSITEDSYEGSADYDGDYSVPISYDKKGVRLEWDIAMNSGFGLTIKTGIVEYKQDPTFEYSNKTENPEIVSFLDNELMSELNRTKLIEDIFELSLKPVHEVGFEDTFVQLYWSNPFKFDDIDGKHVVTVHPYFGAGVWLPTGKSKNVDKAFSMSTGHDGFWGLALEGAISFDFPGTVLLNLGGGLTLFDTKSLAGQRVPTHRFQKGLYPWKADIKKRHGTGWSFNACIESREVFENMNIYFEYLYTKKEKDTVTIEAVPDGWNKSWFFPKNLEDESVWKSQMIQLGFDYKVTENLWFGVAAQSHISGARVYKTHTVMSTITFSF